MRAPFADLRIPRHPRCAGHAVHVPGARGSRPACAEPALLFAALFVLIAAIAWIAGRSADLHFIAAFFALAAASVVGGRFDAGRLLAG
jgi:hypothetical protein